MFINHLKNIEVAQSLLKFQDLANLLWDTSIHPESSSRILISKNIDVFFNNNRSYIKFIRIIQNKFDKIIVTEDINNNLLQIIDNNLSNIIKCEKIIIEYVIGKTFTFKGKIILIEINCYYIRSNFTGINAIEPPFNKLDMLCNIFVHTKDGIRLSKSSGTDIDIQNDYRKSYLSTIIKKQIVNYETYICSNVDYDYHKSYIIKKIISMIEIKNGNSWKFNNLPYTIIKSIDVSDIILDELYCCICQEDLKDASKDLAIVYTKDSNGNKIIGCRTHCKCMNEFILYQTINSPSIYICPYKSRLNFIGLEIDYYF